MYRTEKMTEDYGTMQWKTIALESNYDKLAVLERAIASKEELRVIKCTMDEETFTYTEEKIYECDGAYLKMLDKTRARNPQSENGRQKKEKDLAEWMHAYTTATVKYDIYKTKVEG